MGKVVSIDKEYKDWLVELKNRIRQSRLKASIRVNTTMLELYWSIGADIVQKQAEQKWGSAVISQISKDIRDELPDAPGYSETNLRFMKRFFLFYKDYEIQHQAGAELKDEQIQHQFGAELNVITPNAMPDMMRFPEYLGTIPWRHHVEIMAKCKSVEEAIFYIQQTVNNGWSRSILVHSMQTGLYTAKRKVPNNFSIALPSPQSDLAEEILKDPYQFDFITLTKGYKEKELENALEKNIKKFLLELGQGFSYVGRQIPLEVGGEEFSLDLLLYHLKLHCYVAIELKGGKFHPRDLGQLGFYVSAVNHLYKTEVDNPTVGLIICGTKNNVVAQYALESSAQPIGISEYELSQLIPENYQSALPSIEEIEENLSNIE
ncbi:hypothetical protein AGMMS49983_22070 [Clostridia bacterium]|nr:hypothetical protein AGMMS49983_22070 [Clostridia bacterium]